MLLSFQIVLICYYKSSLESFCYVDKCIYLLRNFYKGNYQIYLVGIFDGNEVQVSFDCGMIKAAENGIMFFEADYRKPESLKQMFEIIVRFNVEKKLFF